LEEALLADIQAGNISLPHIQTDFTKVDGLEKPIGVLTSLETPHRAFDAILRDSVTVDGGLPFPLSETGEQIRKVTTRDATALLQHDPCSLLFGSWDSTGPSGGLGEKFTRCIVSEIVGINVKEGERRGLRGDPLNISKYVEAETDNNNILANVGKIDLKNKKRASEANHGQIPWGRENPGHAGVTMDYADQSATISIPALRRLHFPIGEGESRAATPETNAAGHAILAAIGLHSIALSVERGWHLRSRCDLIPEEGSMSWELLGSSSAATSWDGVDANATRAILEEAIAAAKEVGLPWTEKPLELIPGEALSRLVVQSQQAQRTESTED